MEKTIVCLHHKHDRARDKVILKFTFLYIKKIAYIMAYGLWLFIILTDFYNIYFNLKICDYTI